MQDHCLFMVLNASVCKFMSSLQRHHTFQPVPPPSLDIRDDVVALIPALRAFARTFTLNVSDADDLVQETLMRALRSIEQFQRGTQLKSWLFTIMRNTYCNQYRVRVRETPGPVECVSSKLVSQPTQEWACMEADLQAALARLPTDQREVLMLVGGLGFSYEEAAEIHQCAVGTIKSRLSRAREALAVELGGRPLPA